jgi:hypothetical protein
MGCNIEENYFLLTQNSSNWTELLVQKPARADHAFVTEYVRKEARFV